MQPRIDTNLGIEGEPDAWVHSACILRSNGCGVDIASDYRCDRQAGSRAAPDGRPTVGDVQPGGGRGRLLSRYRNAHCEAQMEFP
jgi:hypothetical protein